jgi:hypothetical protein
MKRGSLLVVALAISLPVCSACSAAGLTVQTRTPEAVEVRIADPAPGALYRVTYDDGAHHFVWDDLSPDAAGTVTLADDKHLRPEHRLRCESRTAPGDPVIFDDLLKAPSTGKTHAAFGVPVSTFGGPGYLVPGLSDLQRDAFGNFWLYLDHPPYALLKYDHTFTYQFALLMPDQVVAFDTDGDGNLYVLHPGNWISKHGPLGEAMNAWQLPFGREPGEVCLASGLAIDREGGFLYLADQVLGRVQRFDLALRLQPMAETAWGWIGREDLAYRPAGEYDESTMYYQLDRPSQLRLDGHGRLLVSCENYISQFDLATGRQLPFGTNPVLGWGGTFTDSPHSPSAALDGHWQTHWLAGVDGAGRIYVADRANDYVPRPRLQVFSRDGALERVLTTATETSAEDGRRVYLTAVSGLAVSGAQIWVVDAAGHVYETGSGVRSGGRLFLGPGAAGRQFDLSRVDEAKFSVEVQSARVRHRSEGRVLAFAGDAGTGNCEREGSPELKVGEQSMWLPARLGEPFQVTLLDAGGKEIPPSGYLVEYEETPGLFGSHYDFFRVTNRSGSEWRGATFVAEARP